MQPTTEKIQVNQETYNKLADWAKPSYVVSPTLTPTLNKTQTPSSTSITPESLQPVAQVKVPQVNQTVQTDLTSTTQPSFTKAEDTYNKAQAVVGTQAQDAQSALTRLAENIFGQKATIQASQTDLEKQAGLDIQQNTLNELNTEIGNQQANLKNELENIRRVPGQTQAQLQSSINAVNDAYGRRLADLAIRQSAATQNIANIQNTVDRKIKLMTAPLDTKITYLSTFAKDNVDFLTKKEQDKLAFVVDDIKQQKADIANLEKAKADMITEIANNGGGTNQAVLSQIQNARNIGEIASIGAKSGYVGALDRALKYAQLSKIRQDIAESKAKNAAATNGLRQLTTEELARFNSTPEAKTINDGTKFYNALSAYKDAIQKYGTGEVFGRGSGEINSAYQSVVGSIKDYYQLGTLDNGVEKLVALGVPKPSIYGIKSNRIGGIDEQMNILSTNLSQAVNQLNNTGYRNTVDAQGLIGKASEVIKSTQDPLGVFDNEETMTSTDPLKIK